MLRLNIQLFGGRGTGSYSGNARVVSLGGIGKSSKAVDLNVAGWTPEAGSRSVSGDVTLNSAEKRIQNLEHEQLVVVDKDGYVVAVVDGEKSSVGITPRAAAAIQAGGIVTHNHPNGGTFSPTDVITAGNIGTTEIRAVSKRFGTSYSLKASSKANGKGLSSQMQKDAKAIEKQWDDKLLQINKRKYANEANYERAVYEAYNSVMGSWMKNNAGKYGYTYSKTKGGKTTTE